MSKTGLSCIDFHLSVAVIWCCMIKLTNVFHPLTWFFPFSVRMLVTLPKGRPRAMTSVSEASLGSFLMWITRDGGASSTLNFLLSLPLEAPSKSIGQELGKWILLYSDSWSTWRVRLVIFCASRIRGTCNRTSEKVKLSSFESELQGGNVTPT